MKIFKRILQIVIFANITNYTFAQSGSLYIQDHIVPDIPLPLNINVIQLGQDQNMHFGGNFGVYTFNGTAWDSVQTPGSVFSLLPDPKHQDKLYVGGENFFGYLKTHPNGKKSYTSLYIPDNQEVKIDQIIIHKSSVFFKSAEKIFIVNLNDNQIQYTLKNNTNQDFNSVFRIQDQVFASIKSKGLYKIVKKGRNYLIESMNMAQNEDFITVIDYTKQLKLLGSSSDELFIFDGKSLTSFAFDSPDYLRKFHLECGMSLVGDQLALGTRLGGVLIVDKQSRNTREVINFQTGLADDEILSMGLDPQKGLWLSHSQGLSRVDLQLPLRDFSTYPGLRGNINATYQSRDSLWVGTTQGLFYLKKTENYDEAQQYIRNKPRIKAKPQTQQQTLVKVKVYESRKESKVGNLINNVFGKKKGGKEEVVNRVVSEPKKPKNEEIEFTNIPDEYEFKTFEDEESKRIYILKSIQYIFEPVGEIKGKIYQIMPTPKGLLVASNSGLFYVNQTNQESILIIPDLRINVILADESSKNLFWIATDKGLYKVEQIDDYWQQEQIVNSAEPLATMVSYKNQLWASSNKHIYRIDPKKLNKPVKSYKFDNPYGQATKLYLRDKYLYLNTWNKSYKFSYFYEILFPQDTLPPSNWKMIDYQNSYQWEQSTLGWQSNSLKKDQKYILSYLNLIPNIQDIFVSRQTNLWASNGFKLYQLDFNKNKSYPYPSHTQVYQLYDQTGRFYSLKKPQFDYTQKALNLNFQLSHPFYLGAQQTRFQYLLKNFDKKWSPLSYKSTIEFTHLPAKTYILQIRAVNALGKVSSIQEFPFSVRPPFWQTWWFYGLQTFVFAGLVFLSYYYNRTKQGHRQAQILTVVTIITVFELFVLLVEPFIEQFTGGIPVFKLFMNILLAVSLNPTEKYVKQRLLRNEVSGVRSQVSVGETPQTQDRDLKVS